MEFYLCVCVHACVCVCVCVRVGHKCVVAHRHAADLRSFDMPLPVQVWH